MVRPFFKPGYVTELRYQADTAGAILVHSDRIWSLCMCNSDRFVNKMPLLAYFHLYDHSPSLHLLNMPLLRF